MHRLPPLSAILAFEAAARHASFSRAAKELCITASAVSHRVRALETFLGVTLFVRRNQRVALTAEAQAYLAPIREALERIGHASALIGGDKKRAFVVSVAPAFAPSLIRSLVGFEQSHPEIELQITPSLELVDFSRGEADAAVRYGAGRWNGLCSHWLAGEECTPVCAPRWLRELRQPSDFARVPLLHVVPRPGEWGAWLAHAGVDGVRAEAGARFQNSALALEAAASGLGAAIVDRSIAADYVDSGRVVAPFAITLPSTNAYYLVYRDRGNPDSRVIAFRDWMLARWRPGTKRRSLQQPGQQRRDTKKRKKARDVGHRRQQN